ncbi:hypothetical protein AGMMS49992_00630 [Clostridia bacterium]|nr:hypothetical protein AGMMS49992_00630 [Clostridia bacterium]
MRNKPKSRTGIPWRSALAVVAALALLLTGVTMSAAFAEDLSVQFQNGNYAFLQIDHNRSGTSPDFILELSEIGGSPAVKVAPVGGKIPGIGISVSSLLSDEDLVKVEQIIIRVGIEGLDGSFHPVSGKIHTYTGDGSEPLTETISKFAIMVPENNIKDIYVKLAEPFTPGAHNYILIEPTQDDGTAYTGKNNVYICSISFRDKDLNFLPVNLDAGADFPEGYDQVAATYATELVTLGEAPFDGGWLNYNSGGDIGIDVWQKAVGLLVEYAPREDGTSPLDTNSGAGKFVIQVIGGPAEQGWREVELNDGLVEKTEGESLKLSLENFDQITEVQNVGYGAWDGADTITKISLVVKKDLEVYELGVAPFDGGWLNYNSGGEVGLEVWQRAQALVVEYAPREDGSSPLDTNSGAGKFVVQVVGGPAEQGWREIELNDGLVEKEEGQSLTLSLEDFDQITEVQNVGYGAWDGADTITRIYLLLK